jgi:hypothetical protein
VRYRITLHIWVGELLRERACFALTPGNTLVIRFVNKLLPVTVSKHAAEPDEYGEGSGRLFPYGYKRPETLCLARWEAVRAPEAARGTADPEGY